LLGLAAKFLGRDFLKPLLGGHRRGIGCPRHGVRRLTSAGDAGERKISRRVAPDYVAFFPRHAENLGARAMYIHHRLGSEVADSRLEGDVAIGLDHEKPVESDGATNVTAERNADAANFRAYLFLIRSTRDALIPFELFGATVERFFQECAGGILALSLYYWSQRRFALGAVDAADRYLVESKFARGFRDDGLDNDNPLQSAWGTLRTARRSVGQHRQPTPAHGLRLVEQGYDASRGRSIADCIVGAVVANDKHIEGRDPSFF